MDETAYFAGEQLLLINDRSVWVCSAMRAGVRCVFDRPDLEGVRVLIQGTGQVSARLAATLAAEGARLSICDIDDERARTVAALEFARAAATVR